MMQLEKKVWNFELDLKGKAMIHNQNNEYHIKIENELRFEKYIPRTKESIFTLKELNYELVNYIDPISKQIVEMTNMICVIYENLTFVVDKFGKLKKILNKDEIKEKWEVVKEKLTKEHPLMSFDIIRAKEFELENMELEMRNLQYIHFLHTYFFMHGRHIEKDGYFEVEEMDRFGNGVVIPLGIVYNNKEIEEGKLKSKFRSRIMKGRKSQEMLRSLINDEKAELIYKIEGDSIYKDEMLEEAEISIMEKLGANYFTHNYIKLKAS